MKLSHLLIFMLAGIFLMPVQSNAQLKARGTASNGTSEKPCIFPLNNSAYFYIINTTNQNMVIHSLDVYFDAGINNQITHYQLLLNGNPINSIPTFPFTLPPAGQGPNFNSIIKVTVFTVQPFNNSHHLYGRNAIFNIESDYSFGGKIVKFNSSFERRICSYVDITPESRLEDADCDILEENVIEFTIKNNYDEILTVSGFASDLGDNEDNSVIEVIAYDADGVEEVSLPYDLEVAELEDGSGEMKAKVYLEQPFGYPNFGGGEPGESYEISLTTQLQFGDITFEETKTVIRKFDHCHTMGRPLGMHVFPNPIEDNSVVEFIVKENNTHVSAYLIPRNPGPRSIIKLMDNKIYPIGTHQLSLPVQDIDSGLYELILEIDEQKFSTSIIKTEK